MLSLKEPQKKEAELSLREETLLKREAEFERQTSCSLIEDEPAQLTRAVLAELERIGNI